MTGQWGPIDAGPGLVGASRAALGTTAQVVVPAGAALESSLQWLDQWLDQADRAANRFRPDSDISGLNSDPAGEREVSWRLADLLRASLFWARRTHGLVDPTVGAALVAAGYEGDFAEMTRVQIGPLPPGGPVPGWWRVTVAGTRVTRPPGVMLDLGATAKAQLADEAARAISKSLHGPALVSLGGDIATFGPAPPGGWVVRISDDHQASPGATGQTVVLVAPAMATSSTAVRRWRRAGIAMHHLIDPRTGVPADSPWRTVSVAAATCLEANALATATLVGGRAGLALIEGSGAAARLVAGDGRVLHLGAWTRSDDECPPLIWPGAAA
ncbi:MAG TPA: FAD:protein FMN transferase [Candidatus Nanopelagicaceae bacterium]|nr:FAD:protein FMN transferase [Candidatus Nanopelagicaceae bacterium]